MSGLIDRLCMHMDEKTKRNMQHDGIEAAAEIERLQSALTESALQVLAHSTQAHEAWEDAERYKYLRDVAWNHGSLIFYAERYGPEDWDENIDAARRATP